MATLIFDFDGTLVDSLPILAKHVNAVREKFNLPELNEQILRGKGARDVVKELGLSWLSFARLVRAVRPAIQEETKLLRLHRGMKRVLQIEGHIIGILTSNSKEVVEAVMDREHLSPDFIHADASIFGKHHALGRFLKTKPMNPIYIGDEVRDVEACRKTHVPVIAVTWGHNTEDALAAAQPDYLVHSPQELLRLIQEQRF